MLFVTLHGGQPGKHPIRNNVQAYDKDGKRIVPNVLQDIEGVTLNELRGMDLVGTLLYVANANRTQNSLLCFEGADTCYRLVSTFTSHLMCKGVLHPFDFTFDDAGHCYVSSQDTNVVTRFVVSKDGRTGTPAPVAQGLPSHGTYLPGTFVASSVGTLSEPPTTPVPQPQGLAYSDQGEKKHSVRGVVWANGALYVADQPADRVKVYDGNGRLVGQSNEVDCPVHLMAHDGSLYVSGGDVVFSGKLPQHAGDFVLSPIQGVRVKNGCGMTFTDSGHFYIASRTENRVLKFDSEFKPMKFNCELPDNPEFLLHV